MGEFSSRLRRAYNAAKNINTSKSYSINAKQVTCPHCGCVEFEEGSAQLNTAFMTFVNLDWADRSATILICKECGHIQWFLHPPEKTENQISS